jgi:hypothetical protein
MGRRLAQSSIGQELDDNERVRVVCVLNETIDVAVRQTK